MSYGKTVLETLPYMEELCQSESKVGCATRFHWHKTGPNGKMFERNNETS
jgi:hypothetical protein